MSSPKVIRWGILATGAIAKTFTKDLLVDPKTRGVTDIIHTVTAAASSSSASRAESFLREVGAAPSARAHDSYEKLAQDSDVDIIYIATPHSHHYQNARLCLEAGKHVLCEKAFTVNAKQAKILVEIAERNGCLLMEAMWTRYFPLSAYVRERIASGKLGIIERVITDCSVATEPETSFKDGTHRMVNPNTAGGALLDLGIYSLTWPFMVLYHMRPAASRRPPQVLASVKKMPPPYDADEAASVLLTFPREESEGGDAHAISTCSMRIEASSSTDSYPPPCVRIQGRHGEIQLFSCAHNPTRSRLILSNGLTEELNWPKPGPGKGSGWYNGFGDSVNMEGEGQGMFWEADEAAYAVMEGRQEARHLGWDETIKVMEVMDEVRKQCNLVYPDKIESTAYPVDL
ncbi:dimeric dihydrodiol dehydrogenase [Thozetella sp. PMI_491]|nr:dimeric dihydrodiol dehydrogenase [Thozetella sp. PMI_491]